MKAAVNSSYDVNMVTNRHHNFMLPSRTAGTMWVSLLLVVTPVAKQNVYSQSKNTLEDWMSLNSLYFGS